MEQTINQIEQEYASQILQAQNVLNNAQLELNNLIAISEERKKSVRDYYEALTQKEQAEAVLAKGIPV